MEWIVKIEGEYEKTQRIRIVFDPLAEKIHFYGEVKVKPTQWVVFSCITNDEIKVVLDDLKNRMEECVIQMRRRFNEYENLDKGFSVLKWVAFEEPED